MSQQSERKTENLYNNRQNEIGVLNMKSETAMKKAVEHAFWLAYPGLEPGRQYGEDELLPQLWNTVPKSDLETWKHLLYQLVMDQTLPLSPVIPMGESGDRYEVDHYA